MKYTFVVNAVISLHVDVEAESLEEAVDKAREAPVMSLCRECAGAEDGVWSTSGELDCGPPAEDCRLVEAWADDEEITKDAQRAWEP